MRALLLVCALSACAGAPLTPQMHERVQRAIAADLVAYPELEGRSFSLSALDQPAMFFQSNFTVRSVSPVTLDYALQVNLRAFALGIDDDMLRGVIGHELAHTLDYQGRTVSQLIELAPQAMFPAHHSWERFTDLVAVDRGFGPGLLRYRV